MLEILVVVGWPWGMQVLTAAVILQVRVSSLSSPQGAADEDQEKDVCRQEQ